MKEIAKLLDVSKYTDYNEMVGALGLEIVKHLPSIELSTAHTFTPGLYSREMVAPAGALITSKIHKTKHQFVVTKGSMLIHHPVNGWVKIQAPYHGVTEANTSRVGLFLEESIWTTFHPTRLVRDKDYNQEEMQSLLIAIESEIIEETKPLITLNN